MQELLYKLPFVKKIKAFRGDRLLRRLKYVILLFIVIYRPFCKYICPLGAIYAVFNPISVFRYRVDMEKCTHCGACARACPMQADPAADANDPECIRCGKCRQVCPTGAICSGCRDRRR